MAPVKLIAPKISNHLVALVVLCMLMLNTGCRMNVLKGEGKKGTNTPDVTAFNAVDIDVSLNTVINIQEGATPSVQIDGYENLLKHIKASVKDNKLRIYCDLDDSWTMKSEDVTATITMPSITSLTLSGAPNANIHGKLTGHNFDLDISGASGVDIDNIATDSFGVEVSGAANLKVQGGNVKYAEYHISGAGTVKAYPLQANEANASISGAGTCHVTALQKLTAGISGAGTIKYKGHPSVSQDVSGAGTIADAN